MDADKAIRGGSDAMLGTAGNDAILTDQTSATSVLAMRQATKNILYTVVNSNATVMRIMRRPMQCRLAEAALWSGCRYRDCAGGIGNPFD